MTIPHLIVLVLLVFILSIRFIMRRMWAITPQIHEDTPKKFDIGFEEVRVPTDNNKTLYGWWIPSSINSQRSPTLVLVHGWSRNLGRMLRYIQHLHPLNYNLLAFDARHHGSSDMDDHASMYKFGRDVKAAAQYVGTRDIDATSIGVIGLSIGGAGSTYAAAIEPVIKAVVTVGAPAHPVDVMKHEFRKHRLPGIISWLLLKQIELKIGVKYVEFAPVHNIAKAEAAFLVIHGEDDKVVLPSQGKKLSAAARPGQCDYWSIPGRSHSNCHHEPGFWDKLDGFFKTQFRKG